MILGQLWLNSLVAGSQYLLVLKATRLSTIIVYRLGAVEGLYFPFSVIWWDLNLHLQCWCHKSLSPLQTGFGYFYGSDFSLLLHVHCDFKFQGLQDFAFTLGGLVAFLTSPVVLLQNCFAGVSLANWRRPLPSSRSGDSLVWLIIPNLGKYYYSSVLDLYQIKIMEIFCSLSDQLSLFFFFNFEVQLVVNRVAFR